MANNTVKKYASVGLVSCLGLSVFNHSVRKSAVRQNILHPEKGTFYPWKYGNVFYQTSGRGAKKLLLLHNADVYNSGADWSRIIADLKKDYTVYVPDLPGCGRSDKPAMEYTAFLYVQFLNSFIKDVINDKVEIWAAGLSAPLAAHCAMMDSVSTSMISSLVMIDPCSPGRFSLVPDRNSGIRRFLINLPVIGETIYHIVNSRRQLMHAFSNKLFFNPFRLSKKTVETAYEAVNAGEGSGRYLMASLQGRILYMNVYRAIAGLHIPTAIVTGEKSDKGREYARAYANINKKIVIRTVPEAGQMPYLEKPHGFVHVMRLLAD